MSSDIAIKVDSLSKCYQIYDAPRDRLKQFVMPRLQRLALQKPKQYFREFYALKDISFEVKKGETVGIIGRNGSGKSTLLQLICGTLNPTSGTIQTNGRIAALLELGSGFNPEFTGRENVYMNASVLGLSNEEIDKNFDDIVTFADIGDFIEQPVKTYSSGMVVRLAFATNIMIDPEIMIIDEALSIGDMNFQAKCMTALTRIQDNGTTILFVSHDMGSIKSLCDRAVYLERGNIKAAGVASKVAEQYIRNMREEMNKGASKQPQFSTTPQDVKRDSFIQLVSSREIAFKTSEEFVNRVAQFRYGTGEVKTTFVELLNLNDEPINFVEFNQKVKVRVFFESYAEKSVSVNVSIFDDKKNNIIGCGFRHVDQPYLITKPDGKYLVEYIFDLPLREGNYSIRINISTPIIEDETAEFIDLINDAIVFQVSRWKKARVWSRVHQFAELKFMEL